MDQNGSITEFTSVKDITAQYNSADRESQATQVKEINKRREIEFKASHILLLGFFSWIL